MKLLVYLLFIALLFEISLNKIQKAMIFDRADVCVLPSTSPVRINEVVFTTVKHCTYINASLEFTRDVLRIKAVTKVIRCANRELLDSCAFFTTLRLKDTCPLAKQNGTLISSMIYSYKPPATCPYRKGPYTLINGTYDPNLLQFFPLDKWYWKVSIDLYDTDTDEYILRICLEGQVVGYYT